MTARRLAFRLIDGVAWRALRWSAQRQGTVRAIPIPTDDDLDAILRRITRGGQQ